MVSNDRGMGHWAPVRPAGSTTPWAARVLGPSSAAGACWDDLEVHMGLAVFEGSMYLGWFKGKPRGTRGVGEGGGGDFEKDPCVFV